MASTRDIIFLGIILFTVGVSLFVINFAVKQMVTSVIAIPVISSNTAAKEAFQSSNMVVDKADYMLFASFIAMILSMMIISYLLAGNPLFTFFYFLVLCVAVVFSMYLSNAWYTVTTMPVFGTTIASFPITNWIITQLPKILSIVGVISMTLNFAKPYVEQQL